MNVLGVQVAFSHLKLNDETEQERWSYFGGATCAAVGVSGSLKFELLLN